MAGRALLLRAEPGFSLPAYERFVEETDELEEP
jgi:hypothetical protein